MCRLLAYQGPHLTVDDLLYRPQYSLINQSYNAHEMIEPLNGDGFGLGWYAPEVNTEPAVFTSISPAWNNRNLRYVAPKLTSPCICAHVRAASEGDVSQNNCHPFHYRNMLMMHNGGVEGFGRIKRALVDRLSDDHYLWIKGQTDSEHLFALFLDHYERSVGTGAGALADALEASFHDLVELKDSHGLTRGSALNMVVTDGAVMVGSRYVDDPRMTPLSLHHTEGGHYVCDENGCGMRAAPTGEQAVLLASEPLTQEAEHWRMVPANHFVLVDEQNDINFRPIEIG